MAKMPASTRSKDSPQSRQSLLARLLKRAFFVIATLSLFFIAGITLFWSFSKVYPLAVPEIEVSTTVLSEEGEVLRQFANEKGIFRQWLTLDEVSPSYLDALIQYEDRYYFHHFGVNPLASIRALLQLIAHGTVVSGSSTLTMQVARLLYPHDRTLLGKLTQMFRAVQLELGYSKAEILTLYINLAPMGGNIEGVGAASERYFSKKASELTLSESALLVALPQRPSLYRPDRYLTRAREARDKVLTRLYDFGEIDEDAYLSASRDPIHYQPAATPFFAPLLAENLKQQYPTQHVISTTIDFDLQKRVEAFLFSASQQFPERVSAGILIVDNQNHTIKTYIGSVDLFDNSRAGFVDMIEAVRSPGSTLKPFAYGMALDYGIIHEASLLTDVPRSFDGYRPQNFDREFRGRIPMFRALQLSLNIPIVQVFEHLTPFYFLKKMRESGVNLQVTAPTLSLILGGVGTTLHEQVRLFSSFANQGMIYPLSVVMNADHTEEPYFKSLKTENAGKPLLSPGANWIITKTLSSVNPPKRLNTRGIAWKTGTSYGYRDALAIGTSPDWTVGVWIGRPDGVPNVGILAADFAAPMLFDIFGFLPKDQTRFIKPAEIIRETACWPSGRKKSQVEADECLIQYEIDTINGNVPRTLYDAKGEIPHKDWPSLVSNEAIATLKSKSANMNTQDHNRYGANDGSISTRNSHNQSDNRLGNSSDNNTDNNAGNIKDDTTKNRPNTYNRALQPQSIKIITLENESIIFKTNYQIKLEAQGNEPFRWYLDGRLLKVPALNLKNLSPGKHKLSVQDEQGNSDWLEFEVRD